MRKKIIKNTIWSVFESGIAMIIGFILARVFVNVQGIHLYGLFLTLSLFSSYGILSMLDFGMGGSITTFVAQYSTTNTEKLKQLWTFSVIYFICIALLACLCGYLIIHFKAQLITERLISLGVHKTILIPTLILVTLSFFSYLTDSFLRGFNDYGYMQRVTVFLHLMRIGGILPLLYLATIEWIMWWLAICTMMRFVILLRYLSSHYRSSIGMARFALRDARPWFLYSMTLFVSSLTGLVFNTADKILIATYLPIASMAHYDIASKPQNLIRGGLSVLLSAIMPAAATYYAQNQTERLQHMFISGTQWITLILMPPLLFTTLFMSDFIRIWMGQDYTWLAHLAVAMQAYLYINISASLGNTMLVGMGMAKKCIPGQVLSSSVNFILSILLVQHYGLKGLVIGTLTGYAIGSVWYLSITCRAMEISLSLFWKKLALPFVYAVSISLFVALVPFAVLRGGSVADFVLSALLYMLLCYIVYFLFLIDRDDRYSLITYVRNFRMG